MLSICLKTIVSIAILGGAFYSAPAFAILDIPSCSKEDAFCGKEPLPFQNAPMPHYSVELIPSKGLPHEIFQLTDRAVRLLPSQLEQLKKPTASGRVPAYGYIVIQTMDDKPFCDTVRKFCWFKKMVLTGKEIHITNWDDHTDFYTDDIGLSQLFWKESSREE